MTEIQPMTARPSISTPETIDLTDRIRATDSGVVLDALESLMTAGFSIPGNIRPDVVGKVYAYALDGLPAIALRSVARSLIRGECGQPENGYLPRPPELAALVRAEARRLADDRRRAIETRDSLRLAKAQRPAASEEAKARVRALVESVVKARSAEEGAP
ncbi:hypothetical protein [Rhizobium rhizosphaerae]|nr:hypothetical protein [Xaviernesmea rhizosphaerae]